MTTQLLEDLKHKSILFVVDELVFEENINNDLLDVFIYLADMLSNINIISISNNTLPVKNINYVIDDKNVSFFTIKGVGSNLPSYYIEEKVLGIINKIPQKEFVLQYKIAKSLSADYYIASEKHLKSLIKERGRCHHEKIDVISLLNAQRIMRAFIHVNNVDFGATRFSSIKESVVSKSPFYFSNNLGLIYDENGVSYKRMSAEIGWGIRNVLSFIIETRDKIEVLFYEKRDEHHATVESVYYLNYFIILMCSLFDNLAWFLVEHYDVKYENVESIKLNGYKKRSKQKSNALFDYFSNDDGFDNIHKFILGNRNFIETFLPLRNLIIHQPGTPSLLTCADKGMFITYNMGLRTNPHNYINSKDMKRYFIEYSHSEEGHEISISPLKFIYAVFDDLKLFLNLIFKNVYKSEYDKEIPLFSNAKSNPICHNLAKLEAI